jgi:ectoine hydroxylase-related dioxygenase (phytanoyl-CoA dioxygenase family)
MPTKLHPSAIAEEVTEGKGYAVLPCLLPRKLVERVRDDILMLREADRATGRLRLEGKRERITCLLGRQRDIEELVIDPVIVGVAERLLGSEFIMSHSPSAHLVAPGAGPMAAHVDWPYWGMRPPFPTHPVLTVQVVWMLEDFTLENGATRVVPGSHKLATWPDKTFSKEAVTAVGEAGSAIIAHGLIWHDTGPHGGVQPRISVLLNYGPFWVRPMSPLTGPDGEVPDEYVATASPLMRKLLGLEYAAAKTNMLKINHAGYKA